jgi:catechol 2,3-dioxygenase-like lactoylglutathione lyase family enzyme
MTAQIDHLVYACPNLEAAIEEMAAVTGVRAAAGGQHPGAGTRNALLSLGQRRYLELIGPDPAQPDPAGLRSFGLDALRRPALRAWAARPDDLEAAMRAARAMAVDLGELIPGRRHTPDGTLLQWRMTSAPDAEGPAIIPFLIDWGVSPHPSGRAPGGVTLAQFVILTPDPDRVTRLFEALGLTVTVEQAEKEGLRAVLRGPTEAEVTLTSD